MITSPASGSVVPSQSRVIISLAASSTYPIKKSELYVNDRYISTTEQNPLTVSFVPRDVGVIQGSNVIRVIVYDSVLNKGEVTQNLVIQD